MIYGVSDHLSDSEYARMRRTPKGCIKLRGASYVFPHGVTENSDFHGFGIYTGEVSTLVSYDTPICDWCGNVLIIDVNAFSYSNTTCRHLSEFLKLYTTLDYRTLKSVYDYEDPIPGQVVKIEYVTVMFV